MVVKMMRWPPWPPLSSRKFEAKLVVHKLQGLDLVQDEEQNSDESKKGLVVEIKWKGQKGIAFRRSVKRNFTEEGGFEGDGFQWNEEFKSVCNLSGNKDGVFLPWEIAFAVFSGLNQGPRSKVLLVGTATLNLSEYASTAKEKEAEIAVPLTVHNGTVEGTPLLHLSLRLMELRTIREPLLAVQRVIETAPSSPSSLETLSPRRDELSVLKAGLRKVKSLQVRKKACHKENSNDRCCIRIEDHEDTYPFDTDSLDDDAEGESEESNGDPSAQLSFNYETLAHANKAGGSFHSISITNGEDESWIYYNHCKPDMGSLYVEYPTASDHEQSSKQSSKLGILAWRKRKLSFISPKPKSKGEPLLKKDCGEEGGDDIDFDRRQLSSSDESSFGWNKSEEGSTTSRSSFTEFGDDNFTVGSWETKEVISRDRHMKLQAQVFFASIDQRSERAAGQSACTALVAFIANWLLSNRYEVPIKSEFDCLIRDGSLEWRNLCEKEDYRQRFPDKHFDLETILQAKICPLSVVPEKSFIGFFHPEGLEGDFDFLHGAMSFDSIWQEISHHGSDWSNNSDPLVYVVSWNDHFFVLKVERDAYYIIDTLGERLYEGCNQAYVLKFDKDTTIQKLPKETKGSDEKTVGNKVQPSSSKEKTPADRNLPSSPNEGEKTPMEEEIVCKGKESCKEYIKSFLAAIPLRELQADIKKGLMASTPLHHRLQIEFHYTQLTLPVDENSSRDVTVC
ncbi:hypothetical protein H0E87_019999 [Populus deltoides]|uniref:C2 NT-type domain-containing protein n=1 Tax=Populus deltoides TaxID=3696 RepID=A0A8T2XXM1_POPDE|nr:hypothetical protein H0E87_019999 [Populus deltoides]